MLAQTRDFLKVKNPLTKASPDPPISIIQLQDLLKIVHSFMELLLCAKDAAYGVHRRDWSWIMAKSMFIASDSLVQVIQQFGEAP